MKDWKDILKSQAEKYAHLSRAELEAQEEKVANELMCNLFPALLEQSPSIQEILNFIDGQSLKEELLMKIDESLDEKDEKDFLYYAGLYKNLIRMEEEA